MCRRKCQLLTLDRTVSSLLSQPEAKFIKPPFVSFTHPFRDDLILFLRTKDLQKNLERQVSAYVEIMLFTMFEFNLQTMNRAFAPPPL